MNPFIPVGGIPPVRYMTIEEAQSGTNPIHRIVHVEKDGFIKMKENPLWGEAEFEVVFLATKAFEEACKKQ